MRLLAEHLAQKSEKPCHVLVRYPVIDGLSGASWLNDTFPPHESKVLRDGTLVRADGIGNVANRAFAIHDQAENSKPLRICKGLEEIAGPVGGL